MWDAYVRSYEHGPSTHHLFIPKPFRMALKTAELRFLDDQTTTVFDYATVLHILQKASCRLFLGTSSRRASVR
jgi:hypothetical protein